MKFLLLCAVFSSAASFAQVEIDKSEVLYDVSLKSGKENNVRLYTGFTSKTLPYSLATVTNGITNFTEKCNNDYKDKRAFSTQADCKYHSDQVIEAFVVKDAKTKSGETLVGRRIYNRGTFEHYELVTVSESVNHMNQKVVSVQTKMLEDQEVAQFAEPKFKKDSAFNKNTVTLKLTELSPDETHISYEFSAETEHWLLNKEIMVPQMFVSISKGMNDLLTSIEKESSFQKRSVASK